MQRLDRYTREGVDPTLIALGLDDPARVEALEETGLLDSIADEAFDRFTRLAARLLRSDAAVINLITDERQVVLSETGLGTPWSERRQMPLSHSFCQHIVSSREPLVVTDARELPLLRGNRAIDEFDIVAYAGVPLIDSDEHVLGAMCVTGSEAREWTGSDIETLRDLAAAVMNQIDLRIAQARLAAERTFLSSVLANLQDAVYACDLQGRPLLMNGAMRYLQGVRDGDPYDLETLTNRLLVFEADGSPVDPRTTPIYAALQGTATARRSLKVQLGEGGPSRQVEISAAPLVTSTGTSLGAVSVAHDVTDRHAADRLREEFFALVSHELRTPLTSIIGYLELLEDEDGERLSDEGRGFLEVLMRNSQRLLRLVGDLLFAAQIESGTMELMMGRLDPSELVTDACESAHPRARDAGVDLRSEIADDMPREIRGDAGRLAQVLDNLLANAIKFTPAGGSIVIGARLHPDGTALELSVTDTGVGIPEAEHAKLFERFTRASTATDNAIQGVGLGLSICKSIVEGHGGHITLDSVVGQGATFRVTLPVG